MAALGPGAPFGPHDAAMMAAVALTVMTLLPVAAALGALGIARHCDADALAVDIGLRRTELENKVDCEAFQRRYCGRFVRESTVDVYRGSLE